MKIANLSLLFVLLLDVMGQGLVIPVLTTLLMDHDQSFLPADTPDSKRQLYFGLTMGLFFFSWFLGAAYISKLSDFIGRKQGILICLTGCLTGYLLTIVALYSSSLPILILARVVTGFTAGNQPIAQAALVDASSSEEEKTRLMGLVMVAISMGLVMGPLLGGFLSDKSILGDFASMELPFYAAAALVLANIILIIVFYQNINFTRRPVSIKITDVFLTLWHAAKRPLVLRLSLVFFWSQLALNTFFVFIDNYLFHRFQFDTLQNSIILVVFGVAMALAGAFAVPPLAKRYGKVKIISATLMVMFAGLVIFMLNPIAALSYVLIVPFVVAFGVNYPLMITLFSASVDETEQGWIMGVSVALYTLGAGLVSLVGGPLMSIDIRLPFWIALGSLAFALALIAMLWRTDAFRRFNQCSAD